MLFFKGLPRDGVLRMRPLRSRPDWYFCRLRGVSKTCPSALGNDVCVGDAASGRCVDGPASALDEATLGRDAREEGDDRADDWD